MDLSSEIRLQTTRSGGKGGQNVNKVETAVIAYFPIAASALLSEEQKQLVLQKLSNRINSEGELWVKAQTHRTQLANKQEAIEKINDLIVAAVKKKKMRLATKMPKGVKEARLKKKKISSELKQGRRKIKPGEI